MADNYRIDLTLEEIFGTGISSVEQTVVSTVPGGINVWTVTLTNGNIYNFNVMNGTAGGDPIPVISSADMTDLSAIYLYLGTEAEFTFGHWYYNNGTWIDGGAYAEKGDPGESGISPVVEMSKAGETTTLKITDANGEHISYINDGVRPVVNAASVASDMTDTDIIYVYVGATTASLTNGDWYFYDGSAWVSGGAYNGTALVTDKTLTRTDMAADSKVTGDEIYQLKSEIRSITTISRGSVKGYHLSEDLQNAFLDLLQHVAFTDAYGQTYYNNLVNAFTNNATLLSISAVFNSGPDTIYDTNTLDDLKQYLTVTAYYDNGTNSVINAYTLGGELAEGTSIITVTYGEKTTTFNVAVTLNDFRKVQLSDVASYINYSDFALNDGTFSASTCAQFSVLEFADTVQSCKFTSNEMGKQYDEYFPLIYAKNEDGSFYGTDGKITFIFALSNGKYTATKTSNIGTITATGKINAENLKTVNIENGVLTISSDTGSLAVTNANMFGIWNAGNIMILPMGMEVKR